MRDLIKRMVTDEDGQGMVEYGLIIGLIAVVLITALTLMSGGLSGIFNKMSNTLNTTKPGTSGTPN